MIDTDKLNWECVSYDKNGNPRLDRPDTEFENICKICKQPQQIFLNNSGECVKCSQIRHKSEEIRQKGDNV